MSRIILLFFYYYYFVLLVFNVNRQESLGLTFFHQTDVMSPQSFHLLSLSLNFVATGYHNFLIC